MSLLRRCGTWIDARLGLRSAWQHTLGHFVPPDAKWWYVFGSASLMFFLIQIVTGICLAMVYVPSAAEAYQSLLYLNYQQPLGWMLRAIHNWSANFMVLMVLAHMTQVFLMGAFKYPRQLTWVFGVFLLIGTLALAFTGQVLRWDQDAYWGLGIGAAISGRTPVIGPHVVHLLLGGPIIAGETLTRFFTLHVFVLPGAMLLMIGLHLRAVFTGGISEMPKAGQPVDRETAIPRYRALIRSRGIPYMPHAVGPDLVFNGLALLAMLACAFIFGPVGPNGVPDPAIVDTVPRPDVWFLWIFAALALLPPESETFLLLTAPVVILAVLLAIPFVAGYGERAASRRPVAVLVVVLLATALLSLTWLGKRSPWSPEMDAWSNTPTPVKYVMGRTPLELQGALVIQASQCRNCHSLGGEGGERGPALDDVATRLSRDQLVRQVLQGGGNMPAYGRTLSPAQVEALVAFLETMHPRLERPARVPVETP